MSVEAAHIPSNVDSREIPQGNGEPVVLVPGFMGHDLMLRRLRNELRKYNYHATHSHDILSTGNPARDLGHIERQLDHEYDLYGPVTLVGHSLGGLYCDYLAINNPEKVNGVITIGSPPKDNSNKSIRLPMKLMNYAVQLTYRSWKSFLDQLQQPLATHILQTHIYNPNDELVDHKPHCESDTMHIVVDSSHMLMAKDPRVMRAVASRLPGAFTHPLAT